MKKCSDQTSLRGLKNLTSFRVSSSKNEIESDL
jgi:hypothetical protein